MRGAGGSAPGGCPGAAPRARRPAAAPVTRLSLHSTTRACRLRTRDETISRGAHAALLNRPAGPLRLDHDPPDGSPGAEH